MAGNKGNDSIVAFVFGFEEPTTLVVDIVRIVILDDRLIKGLSKLVGSISVIKPYSCVQAHTYSYSLILEFKNKVSTKFTLVSFR